MADPNMTSSPAETWAVFVESNTTGNGEELIAKAREHGLTPLLITSNAARYLFHEKVRTIVTNTLDADHVLAVVRSSLPKGSVALVTSTADRHLQVAASVAASLGLRGPDPEAIARCRDKGVQRQVLAGTGVSVPEFFVVTRPDEAERAAEILGSSVVVKPVNGTGSVGVRWCATPAHAREHTAALLTDSFDQRGEPRAARVLIEKAVWGREFSVEILAGAVVGVSETHLGELPTFVEIGHDHPATLDRRDFVAVVKEAVAALYALGLDHQDAHVELRLDDAPTVIEVNPRLPGGFITTLVKLATGVDMLDAHLCQLTGAGVDLTPTLHQAAAIRWDLTTRVTSYDPAGGSDPHIILDGTGTESTVKSPFGDFRDRKNYAIGTGYSPIVAANRAEQALIRHSLEKLHP
jgi:phosphoribosylglycinamide synthetase, ATP-grasp (A) domain